jgi:hypothetical protein
MMAVGRTMADAGHAMTSIAPASPSEFVAGPGVGFIPARRRDDAFIALSHAFALANSGTKGCGPLLIECFDAPAARCAIAWRASLGPEDRDRVAILADAGCPADDQSCRRVDAILAPLEADAARWKDAGFAETRIFITPTPVAPRPSFQPGGESVLCLTPIGPDRGLLGLVDAWAASGSANEGVWNLVLAGPIEDPLFARNFARRAASCPGISITERAHHPELDIAGCAVVIDTDGHAAPGVLDAGARARAIFAPAASPTAQLACEPASPFTFDRARGVRDLIRVFDLLGGRTARDFAEPGQHARERILAYSATGTAARARNEAYRAVILARRTWSGAEANDDRTQAPNLAHEPWGGRRRSGQNPADAARVERALLACRAQGLTRIALYGAGAFVKGCADALCEPPVEVIGFIDDDPNKQNARVWGFPVLCPDVALTGSLDAVILTAPSCEEALWQRTAWFRQARVRVIPLVREHPDIAHARAA